MPFIPPTLNGLRAIRVKLLVPWRGAWVADVELDPDVVDAVAPLLKAETPAVLIIGTTTLVGTIDPRGSSTFVSKASARVVGGRGGWDKTIPAQHFANPGGALLSSIVYLATGGLVGEVVIDATPEVFGKNFVRTAGPASRVFGDKDWHVDPVSSSTIVGPWLPIPFDIVNNSILDFDTSQLKATLSSDEPVFPGTLLIDPRFNGSTYTVRDVEQHWGPEGTTAEVWCADKSGSRLAEAFANMVKEFGGTANLKTYLYRFVIPVGATQLALQAITPGAPDLNPLDQWSGMSGVLSKLTPGTTLVVGFVGGDPSQPYVVSYDSLAIPLEVDIAGGATPLVPSPWAIALAAALHTFVTSLTGATDPVVVGAANVLSTALSTLPPNATLLTKAT